LLNMKCKVSAEGDIVLLLQQITSIANRAADINIVLFFYR